MKTLLLSALLFTGNVIHNDHFINTNWVSKVANKYTESFNLRENNYVVHYNKLSEHTYRGCYSISKDTLIIKERDDTQGAATYHRIKFLMRENKLHFYINEDMVNHHWSKSKVQASRNCIFTKV